MIIKFPDGGVVDTSATGAQAFASTGGTLMFMLPDGTFSSYVFTPVSAQEQAWMIGEIYAALASGNIGLLELLSTAPLPTDGNSSGGGYTGTDMYPNSSATTPTVVSVVGGERINLTLYLTPGQISPLLASFQPGCKISIGGYYVKSLQYVNGTLLTFLTPALVAGTYDMIYSDSRGVVTKAASFIYS